jgi:hypothetical protein
MFKGITEAVVKFIGKIHWSTKRRLPDEDLEFIRSQLKENYLVICTYRSNHLSSFFIGLSDLFLTGRWGRWSHVLINLEDEVKTDADFRLMPASRDMVEAVGSGSRVPSFDEVFGGIQGVAFLKPKSMTLDEWRTVLDAAIGELGKEYDNLFDIADATRVSCVELVRNVLKGQPNYEQDFANFEAMIKRKKNLTPSMFYHCPDFEVIYEKRV